MIVKHWKLFDNSYHQRKRKDPAVMYLYIWYTIKAWHRLYYSGRFYLVGANLQKNPPAERIFLSVSHLKFIFFSIGIEYVWI